ncbi:hypothetical protein [Flavisolibacter ginsengisoli]|jgi:hypothetical protein|uniref:Uncharacterized protein n=1 Tax=Flavisolibacter ginsengisoli DSM 18119 TaxID=1121884 RepID=A0A1M5AEZ7_9BACT|nr:hypothetical protein [Flavisolibacter ginsengisoli]SHF28727.1 hypothetical protein SAMN02745131_02257 [Flavisolibacter ginsengisoli DSM 18119]
MAKLGGKLTSYVIAVSGNLRKWNKLTIGWASYFEMAIEMMKKTDPNAKK